MINQLYRPLCPDRILKIFYEITLIFQNVILTTGSGTDITADIQIPLMLITIIRCKVRNITTLIDFVEKFCPDDINSTVLGQTLTLLKSAIYLIEEMDNKKLSISEDEYQSFVVNSSYIIIDWVFISLMSFYHVSLDHFKYSLLLFWKVYEELLSSLHIVFSLP